MGRPLKTRFRSTSSCMAQPSVVQLKTEADHNKRLFSDQKTGMNACFVICEEQKQGVAETFPCFPDTADSAWCTKE